MEENNKDRKTEVKKGKINKERHVKSDKPTISFDAYFRMLMSKDSSVSSHHKAPMRQFVVSQGGAAEATAEEYTKILELY